MDVQTYRRHTAHSTARYESYYFLSVFHCNWQMATSNFVLRMETDAVAIFEMGTISVQCCCLWCAVLCFTVPCLMHMLVRCVSITLRLICLSAWLRQMYIASSCLPMELDRTVCMHIVQKRAWNVLKTDFIAFDRFVVALVVLLNSTLRRETWTKNKVS